MFCLQLFIPSSLNPLIGRHHELHNTSDDTLKNNLITILAKTKNLCTLTFTVVLYIHTSLPKESLCPARLKLVQIDWILTILLLFPFWKRGSLYVQCQNIDNDPVVTTEILNSRQCINTMSLYEHFQICLAWVTHRHIVIDLLTDSDNHKISFSIQLSK